MLFRTVAFLTLTFMATPTHAQGADVYRWVDDKGKVHYGDAVPEGSGQQSKKIDLPDSAITDKQRAEAEARAAKEKASLAAMPPRDKPKEGDASTPAAPPGKQASAGSGKDTCAERKKKYMDSADCFAPYKMANGTTREEAFKHCTVVIEPDC